jgi:uncharacterized protein (TIGR02453 family)
MAFEGFGTGFVDFYLELEENNTREWFKENKPRYVEQVRGPLEALAETITPKYGTPKIFRPYRDTRFGNDKTPIKETASMWVDFGGAGYYAQFSADGMLLGAGAYQPDKAILQRFRELVSTPAGEKKVRSLIASIERRGPHLNTDWRLATVPRGYRKDHPAADLLALTSLVMTSHREPGAWMSGTECLSAVTGGWDAMKPWARFVAEFSAP